MNCMNKDCVDRAKGYSVRPNGTYKVQFRKKNYGTYKTEEEARNKYLEVKNNYMNI